MIYIFVNTSKKTDVCVIPFIVCLGACVWFACLYLVDRGFSPQTSICNSPLNSHPTGAAWPAATFVTLILFLPPCHSTATDKRAVRDLATKWPPCRDVGRCARLACKSLPSSILFRFQCADGRKIPKYFRILFYLDRPTVRLPLWPSLCQDSSSYALKPWQTGWGLFNMLNIGDFTPQNMANSLYVVTTQIGFHLTETVNNSWNLICVGLQVM